MLVSQCDKRALTETRRILDQFAERRGDRVWQTPITQAGLDTLRRLLRKSARKNTAVACHWLRGRDHAELLWIVGDSRRFNSNGSVPTNTTERDVLRSDDENDWLTGEDIRLLAGLAALFHDLGKACAAFQSRLRGKGSSIANIYRHEWVSLRLVQAFVGQDDDAGWLARLQDPAWMTTRAWETRLKTAQLRDGLDDAARISKPFAPGVLPPLAAAVCWLVLSHHRLPLPGVDVINFDRMKKGLNDLTSQWNQPFDKVAGKECKPYWQFPYGLPCDDRLWRERVASQAGELGKRLQPMAWLDEPYPMHLARLLLMLADHHFSSQNVKQSWKPGEEDNVAFANTLKDDPDRRFNQTLPEHLTGVMRHALGAARALPGLATGLASLGRHRILQQRSADARFRWQDKAFDLAGRMRDKALTQGAFIVNLASTGCGKTLANARIMYALANPATGMRCVFAMGLRTLTLQTGLAFRDKLKLDDGDLAIRVGGAPSRELFEHLADMAEARGSESSQPLLDTDGYVRYDGNPDHPLLQRLSHDPKFNALLAAPLLVCTIDHLTPATESTRGGRQIAPMLRLMSSDLVLDEPDDFSVEDMPALIRLVYWAGLLGSRVLISSATLPPALTQGLFDAYLEGRRQFQRHRGQPGQLLSVCCLWTDERETLTADCMDRSGFASAHAAFADRRAGWLSTQPGRRTAELLPLTGLPRNRQGLFPALATLLRDNALRLHALNHDIDPSSGKHVSIGLLRFANIDTIYPLAQELCRLGAPHGVRIHLCVYHSQYPLLLRSAIERRLDAALTRHDPAALFAQTDIRARLNGHAAGDHLFIVLGSPVTEVGRDHCYSWAIAEPSSMRSLIQLAGRVRRHWPAPFDTLNLLILQQNIKSWLDPDRPAYSRPGFETAKEFRLVTPDLNALLTEDEYRRIDARPRLLARPALRPHHSLVDLEHARLDAEINGNALKTVAVSRAGSPGHSRLCAASCWQIAHAMLQAGLQRVQPFRKNDYAEECELVLLPDEEEQNVRLIRQVEDDRTHQKNELRSDYLLHRISDQDLFRGPGIGAWGNENYLDELAALAGELDMSPEACARRFGHVALKFDPDNHQGWLFHPALGFCQKR
ncbi:type I-F CRISPR-associated helicase Cas3 [Paludibacterium paludis]|uniref:Type I-F CRISPR-associated helicase Cas3 n=2 Tax=Paludibacterium paludis TaxID=1225769 RepID=A0A918UAP9_9NEIS|nr:type I-F CRISPR-associated helicase Cas3 [Paludibacterium paludis]